MDTLSVDSMEKDNPTNHSRAHTMFSKLTGRYIDGIIESKNKILRSRIEEEKAEEVVGILDRLEKTVTDYLVKYPNSEYIPIYSIDKINTLRVKDRNDVMVDIVHDNLVDLGFEVKVEVSELSNYKVFIKNSNYFCEQSEQAEHAEQDTYEEYKLSDILIDYTLTRLVGFIGIFVLSHVLRR